MTRRGNKAGIAFTCALIIFVMQFFPNMVAVEPAYAAPSSKLEVDCLTETFNDVTYAPNDLYSTLTAIFEVSADKKTVVAKMDAGLSNGAIIKYLDDYRTAKSKEPISGSALTADAEAWLPDIKFDLFLDESFFVLATPSSGALIADDGVTHIGTWELAKVTNGYLMTATLNKENYAYHDIYAGFELSCTVKDAEGGDKEVEVDNNGGKLEVTVKPGSTPPTPTAGAMSGKYKIEKSGPKDVDNGNSFSYVIKATSLVQSGASSGAFYTMDGLYINDIIPSDLEVCKVEVTTNGGVKTDVPLSSVMSGSALSYAVPSGVTSAAVYITVRLNGEEYKDYVIKGFTDTSVSNIATLEKPGGDPEDRIESESVDTRIKISSFMNKTSETWKSEGKYPAWTITVESNFSSGASVYLVDYIEDTSSHVYTTAKSITVREKGKTPSLANLTLTKDQSGSSKPYETLTAAGCDALMLANPGAEAVFYTYANGTSTSAVMVIPLKAELLNKPITVQYCTEISSGSEFGKKVSIENEVKIVWDWLLYGGDGVTGTAIDYDPNGNGLASKGSSSIDYSLLRKGQPSTGYYDIERQILGYDLEVNRAMVSMPGFVLTDTLDDNVMRYLEDILDGSGEITATIHEHGTGATKNTVKIGSNPSAKNYYEVTTSAGFTTLKIVVGDTVAPNEYWKVRLYIKVVDGNFFADQNMLKTQAVNTATIVTTIGGIRQEQSSKDTNYSVSMTWILKKATRTYNYQDHSLGWEVNFNVNFMPVSSAAIADRMPTGTAFGKILAATRTSIDQKTGVKTEESGHVAGDEIFFSGGTPCTITCEAVGRNLKFYAGDIKEKITIAFTTVYTDEYRKENFNEYNTVIKARNTVTMGGFVYGVPIRATAIANANHTFVATPITKSGIYIDSGYDKWGISDAAMAYANWEIIVNRERVDMSGAAIIDELQSHFALVMPSMTVSAVEFDAAGKIVTRTAIPNVMNYFESISAGGFKFVIPEAISKTAIVFNFDTTLVADASGNNMRNKVELIYADGSSTETENELAEGSKDFSMSVYAGRTSVPYIKIIKTSASGGAVLSNAAFLLYEMEYVSSNWVTKSAVKTVITNSNGEASFTHLKKDTLYRIDEISAPVNFVATGSAFVIFDPASWPSNYPPGTTSVSGVLNSSSVMQYIWNYEVENTPKALPTFERGTISLEKLEKGKTTTLAGAQFGVYTSPGGTLVAYVVDTASSPAVYKLSNTNGTTTLNVAVNDGSPKNGAYYLKLSGAGVWTLLEGSYYVKELVAPSGYALSQVKYPILIEGGNLHHTITAENEKKPTTPTDPDKPKVPGSPDPKDPKDPTPDPGKPVTPGGIEPKPPTDILSEGEVKSPSEVLSEIEIKPENYIKMNTPKTGDDSPPMKLLMLLMVISILGIAFSILGMRRIQKQTTK